MARIALIDNLNDIAGFADGRLLDCSAEQLLHAAGGNTGNLAFVLGTRRAIADPVTVIGWGADAAWVRQHFDQIVICCANQIGAHVDLAPWADRLAAFGLPATLIGLGAQTTNFESEVAVPDGTRRFLATVAALRPRTGAPGIGVRGEFTRQVLARLDVDSAVIGCPSLFISGEAQLGQAILRRQPECVAPRVAAAAGNPYHATSAHLDARLKALVEGSAGAFILQHTHVYLSYALDGDTPHNRERFDHLRHMFGPEETYAQALAWFRRHAYAFADCGHWLRFLGHYDYALGPRYHGVALGVQAGIPGCVIAIDNRTRELSDTTGIKSVSIAEFDALAQEEILPRLAWSAQECAAFDANRRRRGAAMRAFLEGNGIAPAGYVADCAD